jgi:hypothetical protein
MAGLLKAGSVLGSVDGHTRAWVTAGAVYLVGTANFLEFMKLLRANITGASNKTIVRRQKVAGQDLVVTIAAGSGAGQTQGFAALLITLSTPILQAKQVGIDMTVAIGGGATQSISFEPVVRKGDNISVMQVVVLAVSDNAGRGSPARGNSVVVTCADGVGNPGLVDGATILEVETINLRDF